MVVVVVVVDSWLCLFPKAAVLPFPRPPWLQPGPTPFPRLGPDLQILQDLEDCSWKIRDNSDPLLALKWSLQWLCSGVCTAMGVTVGYPFSKVSLQTCHESSTM